MKLEETVVLIHGLGRTKHSMRKLARQLQQEGYGTHAIGYPSRKASIEQLSANYVAPVIQQLISENKQKIHIVTHSLGGILIRYYLQKNTLPAGSRIVMLCPPNHGSEVVDNLSKYKLINRIMGPAFQQLTTDEASLPNQMHPIIPEVGIITGKRSLDPWFNHLFQKHHDGKVSIASAKLDEMKDFLIVNCDHTFIMNNQNVIKQTIHFLRYGKFR